MRRRPFAWAKAAPHLLQSHHGSFYGGEEIVVYGIRVLRD
jgi:hypothetical protein